MLVSIEISLITINKQAIQEEHVQDFVEILNRGISVLPITVTYRNGICVLVDGRHRLAAHKELGLTHIKANTTL